jgi:hypothetical protein
MLSPLGMGWKLGGQNEENELEIDWMDGQPAPKAVLDLLACNCSTSCKLNNCSCKKNGLKCTKMCKKKNCKNQRWLKNFNQDSNYFLNSVNIFPIFFFYFRARAFRNWRL